MKNFLKKNLFFIFLLIFSLIFPYVVGHSVFFLGMLITWVIFILLHRISYYLFAVFFSFILLTGVFVLPKSLYFGDMGAMVIAPIFETDLAEAKEFARALPLYIYGLNFLFFLFGVWILYLGKKFTYAKKSHRITGAFALLTLAFVVHRPMKSYFVYNEGFNWVGAKISVISFYVSVFDEIQRYKSHSEDLSKGISENPTWDIVSVSPKYKNYVLIIGESVRRDYMSLYGFPIENSSFLKSANGKILEGFTAAAPNTIVSLTRTFIQMKDDDFLYANNIISLAKQAGFETCWISNQGAAGDHDKSIAQIAVLSDTHFFTKKGAYYSTNYYDSVLLPIFKEQLAKHSDKPRLFVLHLMGSHPEFSYRLEKPLHYNYKNLNLSAYLQTIEQTDKFIADVYEILLNKWGGVENFSVLYFADHGLVTKNREISLLTSLTHGASTKAAYQVPFVLLSSDDVSQEHIKIEKSAFRFLDGFASWLGIQEKSLRKEYDFFSLNPDSLEIFNGNKKVPFHSLEEDLPMR